MANGLFERNSLGSPWIYIGLPTCVLGYPIAFLWVLQDALVWVMFPKKKLLETKEVVGEKTILEENQIPVRNCT